MSAFLGYLAIGVTAGATYALLALGMVLIYKGTRVLNLAHPFFGLFCAFFAWWLTFRASYPPFSWLPFGLGSLPRFGLAVVLALATVGLNGWLLEHTLFRRLRRAPRLVLLVLTIALAQSTAGLVSLLFYRTRNQVGTFRQLPSVSHFSFKVGTRFVTANDLTVLGVTIAVGIAAVLFFTRTRFGVAVRAAAENEDAARLLGISSDRVASFVWVTGSVLAGIAGLLITQVVGTLDTGTLSVGFLVRGLTAALIGGLTSLPGAVAGGLAVGVTEYLIRWQTRLNSGLPETILFAVVIAVLVFRPGGLLGQREEIQEEQAFVPAGRDLPARLRGTAAAAGVRMLGALPVVAVLLISLVVGSRSNDILTLVVIFAMVGVSLTVLLGYAGQISLGHWGLAGVGAFTAANLYTRLHVPYLLALPLTVIVGMAVSLIIGIPALRIRGLYLAIVTLAFNIACELYLFKSDLFGGTTSGILVHRPTLGPFHLDDPSRRPLFFFSVLMLALCLVVARNLARSRTGRAFNAVRENEKMASILGVSLTQYKLQAFVVSGGIAALAGALYATYLGVAVSVSWDTATSLTLVSIVVIGGIGSLSGSVLGAFLVIGVPQLFELKNGWIVPIATGALLVLVLTRARGGMAGLVQTVRTRFVEALVQVTATQPTRTARTLAPPS